jgi:glycine/D-amino acid oxidase-like deaminating enzyme
MTGGGWLEPVSWLEATRDWLRGQGSWSPQAIEEGDVEAGGDYVVWNGVRARHLVFCHGLAASGSRFFPGLPFRPASGDVLEVRLAGGGPKVVWNSGGKWLAPREDGTCLCGATYGFGEWVARPRPEGSAEIRRFLDGLLADGYEVTGHRAGVRPILHQSRPLAGFHQDFPRVGMLNGLGSKGVLTAPWAAAQLVEFIVSGKALDPELELAKFPRWAGRPNR